MVRTRKIILVSLLFAILVLALSMVGFTEVHAASNFQTVYVNDGGGGGGSSTTSTKSSTPKYKTYGKCVYDGVTHLYPPSEFSVYMYSSSASGSSTIYGSEMTSWSTYNITVEPSSIRNHVSFKLTRSGYTIVNKSLSGKDNLTLYSGYLSDGTYILEYVANVGNLFSNQNYVYTYEFRVDNTKPSYTLKAGSSTISSGSRTNKQITYTAEDMFFSYISYQNPRGSSGTTSSNVYTITPTESNNGWWYLYAVDVARNSNSTVSVYLDTIAPTGTVLDSRGRLVSNGGYTNLPIKYTATDADAVSYYHVKLPGSTTWTGFSPGTTYGTTQGWYTFRSVDRAGNVSEEYKVYYDATKPTATLYGGGAGALTTGSFTNSDYVKYVATDTHSGIANCYVKMPNTSYYTVYASGTQLATEGTYYFYAIDKSGNQTAVVSVTLDKTAPTGTIYGGSYVVPSDSPTNADFVRFAPADNIGVQTAYVQKPSSGSFETYTRNARFTEEGEYKFYVTDKAGNSSQVYTVVLDRAIPFAQLYVDELAVDNNTYTRGDHIKFVCDASCYVRLPDTDEFVEYLSTAEYYKPGKYVFYGISDAGNSTGYFTIVIDRTVKTVEVENVIDGITNGDTVITWTDGDADKFAPIASVTVNGVNYTKDSVIHTIDTGVYVVAVTDAAGNYWETQFASTKKNILTDTLQKEYFESFDATGTYYAYSTYDGALQSAKAREQGYVRTGEWKSNSWDMGIAMDAVDSVNAKNGVFYIYKKSGSSTEEVAYFTLERLDEVITEYAKVGIESYYYWEKQPSDVAVGENLYAYSDTKTILANSIELGENIGVLLNGEQYVDKVVDREGRHILTVIDDYGNTCEYNLVIVRSVPKIEYAVGDGNNNLVTFDRTYYFKDQVSVEVVDSLDEFAMFSIFDGEGNLLQRASVGDRVILTESGSYSVTGVNHYGVTESFNLVISRNAPEVQLERNVDTKQFIVNVTASKDSESTIQTLEIYKSLDDGKSWYKVSADDYGTLVSLETLSYKFRTTGLYKVVVTDQFRTGIDAVTAQLDYEQPIPVGELNGVIDGGYTNKTVSFTWTDEAVVTVTKDGVVIPYESEAELIQDGVYVITLENYDGYKATYTFTIDTQPPVLEIQGATHKEYVNQDVKVYYTEEELEAELYKDGKLIGEYYSGNPVSADGGYRIVVRDRAGNSVTVEFTIDKVVDYAINIVDKGLANSVVATANEQVDVQLTRDGKSVEYALGTEITVPGNYTLVVTDHLGNNAVVLFTIVEPLVQSFSHNLDNVQGLAEVRVNGEVTRLNYGTLELKEDGVYEVVIVVSNNAYLFKVTVDATAPTVTLEGVDNGGVTKESVKITGLSEQAEFVLTKDGQRVKYKLGDELNEAGEYKLSLTDECGNSSEYTFTIDDSLDWWVVLLIAVGSILAVGGVVLFAIKLKREETVC